MTPAVANTRDCSSMKHPAAGRSTGFRDAAIAAMRDLSLRGASRINPCDQTGHLTDDSGMIARPVELKCAGACFCGHPSPILGRATKLLHALSKSVDIARSNQKSFDAVADDRSRRWRDHAGKTAGQRLVGDHGGALEKRGKHEDISRGHPCRNVSMRDSS